MTTPRNWNAIGARLGTALAYAAEATGLADIIRAGYLARFGKCRRCDSPLAGPSPEQVCEPCHVHEMGEALSCAFAGGIDAGDDVEA